MSVWLAQGRSWNVGFVVEFDCSDNILYVNNFTVEGDLVIYSMAIL